MSNAPKKIYLQIGPDCTPDDMDSVTFCGGDVTWCVDRIYETDLEYVQSEQLATLTTQRDSLREDAAIAAMQALIPAMLDELSPREVASDAVRFADALVAELKRTEKEVERG